MPELSPDLERHNGIKKRLREVGSSLSQIASELGRTNSTITVVSQGYRRSHSVQAAIAYKLGLTPEELFPERYGQAGGHTMK
ncbi:helix-turn-helix domain-containing protein [Roseobacter sinensis]|uniref:helix-turn-helix domain-containing protein n=1 Tax=Roseobacter sinensis TaxID=2931391 RepID=UPI00384EBB5A